MENLRYWISCALPDPEGSGILSALIPFKIQIASITSLTPAGGDFIVFITVISYKRTSKWGLKNCIPTFCDWLKNYQATFLSNQNWNWKQSSPACTSFPAPSTWLEQANYGKHCIDWVKIITPLFLTNQSWNWKHSSLCMHMFSRAWRPLHILGSNSDGLWTDSLSCDWTTTKFTLLK